MTPQEFCDLAMAEYERQWAAAAGHQERHPLRVKMEHLKELAEQAQDPDEFSQILVEGSQSADPLRGLLCAELSPWWKRLHGSKSGA